MVGADEGMAERRFLLTCAMTRYEHCPEWDRAELADDVDRIVQLFRQGVLTRQKPDQSGIRYRRARLCVGARLVLITVGMPLSEPRMHETMWRFPGGSIHDVCSAASSRTFVGFRVARDLRDRQFS